METRIEERMSAPRAACVFMTANSLGSQLSRLVEDELWNRELAHVVEQGGGFDRAKLAIVGDARAFAKPTA